MSLYLLQNYDITLSLERPGDFLRVLRGLQTPGVQIFVTKNGEKTSTCLFVTFFRQIIVNKYFYLWYKVNRTIHYVLIH